MATKNLKHGLKVSKRDIVLQTSYVVAFNDVSFYRDPIGPFSSKLEAINRLTEILKDPLYKIDDFNLIRCQLIKLI